MRRAAPLGLTKERVAQKVKRALNDRARPSVAVTDIEGVLAVGVIHVIDFNTDGHRRGYEGLDRTVDDFVVLARAGHEHPWKRAANLKVMGARKIGYDLVGDIR
jgi:hypothetical protein